ncbi:unnamed protein product, partial [Discosporangium mesarthrocarpum]
ILHKNDRQVLVGYADSDWGTDAETRRSVTGYLLLVNNSPVPWRSKLQGLVFLSSSEVEWTAMAHGMCHCIYIRGILGELVQDATPWYCDNRGAIQASSITGFNGRTKHVDMKLKCTREYVEKDLFNIQYVSTTKQLADILTKRL